jgi:abhydrolase domain-containing protein 13
VEEQSTIKIYASKSCVRVHHPTQTVAINEVSAGSMERLTETTGSSSLLVDSIFPFLLKLGSVVSFLVVLVGGIVYVKQDALLYFPEIAGIPKQSSKNPRGYRSPEERQLPYENHMIQTEDGVRIHAWLLLHIPADTTATTTRTSKSPTIIFFHGNAGNIGLRLPNAMKMIQLLQANVLLVEYRGYGNSDDTQAPTEAGLQKDAVAALLFCQQPNHAAIDPTQIFIFGRSLGGAVAFYLADYAQRMALTPPLAGLIVENTFLSVSHMVDHLMPFLRPFKPFVLRIGWKSYQLAPRMDTPTLYLAGARDELVPHAHMEQLAELQRGKGRVVQMHIVPDGTHNETWLQGGPAYWNAIRLFMQHVLEKRQDEVVVAAATATSLRPVAQGALAESTCSSNSIPTMSSRFIDMARGVAADGKKMD